MVRYLFYTIGDLTYQSPLVLSKSVYFRTLLPFTLSFWCVLLNYAVIKEHDISMYQELNNLNTS